MEVPQIDKKSVLIRKRILLLILMPFFSKLWDYFVTPYIFSGETSPEAEANV